MQVGAEGDAYTMYPFEASFSGPVFELDGNKNYTKKLNLGGEKGKAFAQWLAANGQAGTKVLDTNVTYDIAVEAFKTGKSPYILGGPWMINDFKGMNIVVDPIPAAGDKPASPFLGVQGGFINAGSTNQLLATDFLVNYVGSKQIQDKLYEIGQRVPALTASADVATAIRSWPALQRPALRLCRCPPCLRWVRCGSSGQDRVPDSHRWRRSGHRMGEDDLRYRSRDEEVIRLMRHVPASHS